MKSSPSIFIKFYLLPVIFTLTTAFYFAPFAFNIVSPGKLSGFLFAMNLIVWGMLLLSLGLGYLIWVIRHAVRKTLCKHHWFSSAIIYSLYMITITLFSLGFQQSF